MKMYGLTSKLKQKLQVDDTTFNSSDSDLTSVSAHWGPPTSRKVPSVQSLAGFHSAIDFTVLLL